jgi:hypothetical protein
MLGSCVRVRRSLDVDQLAHVELAERGHHNLGDEEECRDLRSGKVWRRRSLCLPAAGNIVRRVLHVVRAPTAFWIMQARPCRTLPLPIIARHT